jgi:hypothetical protein
VNGGILVLKKDSSEARDTVSTRVLG